MPPSMLHALRTALLLAPVLLTACATDVPPLRGLYRYMADAASFTDCATGRRLPVAQEGDNLALERAYLAARAAPGAPLLVTVQGRVLDRPRQEGTGVEPALVVDRFIAVAPSAQCPR